MSRVPTEIVNVGVIGLGFMGRTHVGAVQAAQAAGLPCRLAAVADADPRRLTGHAETSGNLSDGGESRLFDPGAVECFNDPNGLITSDAVDLVHVCTWTDTHVDLAIAALEAGKHVVVEKPVAHTSEEVSRLARAANGSDKLCMPAMVMRFWPEWVWLRERIKDGSLGTLHSLVLTRLGSLPDWTSFYNDEERSGGAMVDLHVHDADFVTWCFGAPESVSSGGTPHHLTSVYRFAPRAHAPRHVVAEGGWGLDPAAGFRMRFVACFDEATAEFDLGRTPSLMLHATRDGESTSTAVEVSDRSGYELEIAAAIRAVASGDFSGLPTVEEAIVVMRMLEAEYRSIHSATAERVMCRWR